MNKCRHPDCTNIVIEKTTKGAYKLFCSNKCRGSGNSLLSRNKARQTCTLNYGKDNPSKIEFFRLQSKKTCLEKYGVDNPSKSKIIKEKKIETCIANFGVNYPLQSAEVQEKKKNTCMIKYGVDNQFKSEQIKDKIKKSYLKKYGVEYPGQVKEIKDKIILSNIRTRGVRNPSQCPKVQNKIMKSGLTKKEYIFPSGKRVLIQGYENLALDYLLTIYEETDIIVGDATLIPVIKYLDDQGNNRVYFPDIYIPKEKFLMEVKSTYTYEKDKIKNTLKKEACEKLGYKFEFYIGEPGVKNGQNYRQ